MLTRAELQRRNANLNRTFNSVAKVKGATAADIRKQFVFALFWKRLYLEPDSGWILLGGNALLIRTGGGRHTSDVDVSRESTWQDTAELHAELQEKLQLGSDLDEFELKVDSVKAHSEPDALGYGTKTATATVQVTLMGKAFDQFKIDITSRKFIDSPVEYLPLKPVFEDTALSGLPLIPTVPIENHIADKISAMYDTYGHHSGPSTRYRDLADIVRILKGPLTKDGPDIVVDAERLSSALTHEAERRKIQLPATFIAPGPLWATEFARQSAQYSQYPSEFVDLTRALDFVSEVLGDVLNGKRVDGVWSGRRASWG